MPISPLPLTIEGMSCASCSARVEKALQAVPGVQAASVNLATNTASITGTAPQETLIQAVRDAGFDAYPVKANTQQAAEDRAHAREVADHALWRDFIIAALLWLLLMGLTMGHGFKLIPLLWQAPLQWALATIALIGPGRRFLKAGIPALLRRSPNMHSLVALGTLAAYLYSSLVVFFPTLLPEGTRHLYFEAVLGIITLVLLGRALEARAKGRTSAALEKLTKLQPQEAHLLQGEHIIDRSIAEIKTGDHLLIRPGERVPLDGVILTGDSHIDESMLTGEPLPVLRTVNDPIIGGTINQEGALTIRATATGADTMLARIIQMVEQAQGGKLPIQSLVDKITLWFVPVIIALAALTFIAWFIFGPAPALSYALVNAIAVLIAACPCAMGLATPTAIMVGTGKGAEMGILFRKGEALQTLETTRLVAFDKTGTLTEGHPHLTHIHMLQDDNDTITESHLLALTAAVERHADHPIGRAIIAEAEKRALPYIDVTNVRAMTGLGIEAQNSQGDMLHIGNRAYMQSLPAHNETADHLASTLSKEGVSPLYVAYKGKIVALMGVSDPIRPSAQHAIATLKSRGLRTAMITGDIEATARHIAQQAGIDDVIAHVLPQEKGEAVQKLQRHYGAVAFVGDGINDAPALAQADTGIAIGHGTDIAIEAADLVLTSDTLMSVPNAIALSHATLSIIRQNLFWAFAYNIVLIPLAAGVLYPATHMLLSPLFAAGAMGLSSVFVLGNTLRLRRFKPLPTPPLPQQRQNA